MKYVSDNSLRHLIRTILNKISESEAKNSEITAEDVDRMWEENE